MRVIITGARSPACLEWARLLHRAGCAVAVADSVRMPLARFSACIDRWFHLPAPVHDVNAYGEALLTIARSFQADCILPTCEEAFYIAHQKRRLESQCRVFTPDFDQMAALHDKGAFAELSQSLPLSAPPTMRLESVEALAAYADRAEELVFKPVYSRFAAHIYIRPLAAALKQIHPNLEQPWIVQQFVAGREICSYSILQEGRLLAHACYHPKYRVGKGSGIYLEPENPEAVQTFVQAFGRATCYTGQVGFDFIQTSEQEFFVLECNPRATSGIHLFASQPVELANRLQNPCAAQTLTAVGSPRMVRVAMALFAAPRIRSLAEFRDFLSAWRKAEDIIASPGDRGPLFAQMLGLGEIAWKALRTGRPMLSAATQDIEWNGQPLGAQP